MAKFWIQLKDSQPLVIEADMVTDLGKGLILYIASSTPDAIDVGLDKLPDCIQETTTCAGKTLILRDANYRNKTQKVVWEKGVVAAG